MTSKSGEVLPKCAAQIAVLEATGKSMNKALGEMSSEFKEVKETIQEQKILTATLTTNMEKLSNSIENLNEKLDNKIEAKVNDHENKCVFHQVARKRTEDDITKRFKLSSIPPTKEDEKDQGFLQKLPGKIKFYIYLGVGIATITTTVIGVLKTSGVI